jgi:hypothetical protein
MNGVIYEKLKWPIGSWISAIKVVLLSEAVEDKAVAVETAEMLDEEANKHTYQW